MFWLYGNPFAVGAAVSSLVDAGIQVNQGIIIALGAILWIATTAVSIIYVMKYAAKVKKDRGSTILSLQEQEAEKENFGKDNALEDVKLTGRQKGALIVFAIAFIVMVISFIPWEDFGVEIFLGWSAVITAFRLVNGTSLRLRAGSSSWPSLSPWLAVLPRLKR